MLAARIESFGQSYFLSENRQHQAPVQDEAIIDIVALIERISPKLKQHLDQQIDIRLACSQSFSDDEPPVLVEDPFLVLMTLTKGQRSCMAYVPSTAFWSIPAMIDTGKVTHIEARFGPIRRGSGNLLSLYLIPASKLTEL